MHKGLTRISLNVNHYLHSQIHQNVKIKQVNEVSPEFMFLEGVECFYLQIINKIPGTVIFKY